MGDVNATNDSPPFRFAQITDTHIFGGGEDFAVLHEPTLRRVLADIETHLPESEFVIHTGDVGGMAGRDIDYQLHRQIVASFSKPIHYIPGNHDLRLDGFRTILLDEEASIDPIYWSMVKYGWLFVALDSSHHPLDAKQLGWLTDQLEAHGELPTIICIHHTLLPLGMQYHDLQLMSDGHTLVNIFMESPQVRAVISGHVHMDRISNYHGISFITTPSTVFQNSPSHHEKTHDNIPPGYRVFSIDSSGAITTYIRRVSTDSAYTDNVVTLRNRGASVED